LLQQLPQTPERVGQELQCQMTLSGALMVVRGYAAPEVEQACSRAHALCQQLGDTPYLGPVTLALHRLYVVRGELLRGHDIAEHLLRFAQKGQDQDLLLVSHVALGTSWLFRGELRVAGEHLTQAQHLYEPQQHQSFVLQYGDDPLVASATFEALILALLGYAD
jgi:predicted ATPase